MWEISCKNDGIFLCFPLLTLLPALRNVWIKDISSMEQLQVSLGWNGVAGRVFSMDEAGVGPVIISLYSLYLMKK